MLLLLLDGEAQLQGITGSLAATETGSDSAALSGSARVSGSLTAADSGADTAAAGVTVRSTGSLVATDSGSDTAAATGTVRVSGPLIASDTGADGFSGSGSVVPMVSTGSLAAAETGSDAFAGTGAVAITGAQGVAESGSDIVAGTAENRVSGALAGGETGSDGVSALGSVPVSGVLAADDNAADVFAGAGEVEDNSISGSLNVLEAETDTALASGAVSLCGECDCCEADHDGAAMFAELLVSGSLSIAEIYEDVFRTAGAPRRTCRPSNISGGTRWASDLSPQQRPTQSRWQRPSSSAALTGRTKTTS
jgi:hypothetical protein